MIDNIDKFWKELSKYNIFKLEFLSFNPEKIEFKSSFSFKTSQYLILNLNINRAMVIYQEILNSKSDEFKYSILCENCIIHLITALEVYLSSTFRSISIKINIGQINYDLLKKFINKLRINISFKKFNYDSLIDIKLFHILPKRIEFQEKSKCKVAFSLFNIDLTSINEKIWEKIFSKNKESYLNLRHRIIHGVDFVTFKKFIDLEIVENCFLEICKFLYLLEEKIVARFPELIYKSIDLKDKEEREKIAVKLAEDYEKYLKY